MQEYKAFLKDGLERYFDIKEDYELGSHNFELYASFNQRNAKYMLLKNVEIYAFKNNEYIFLKKLDRAFDLEDLKWLRAFLDENLQNIIEYDKEHMSSVVTVIFEAPMPDEKIQKQLLKFKYYKSFSFGLRGWVNAKVMLIDPVSRNGITNKLGKGDLDRFVMN